MPTSAPGGELINDDLQVVRTDTVTAELTTVFMDSVETQGNGVVLQGRYDDPEFGEIKAKGYLQLSIPHGLIVSDDAELDSLRFVSELQYLYGNDELPLSISIHRVQEKIEPPEDRDRERLFNFDEFAYDPNALGRTIIVPDQDDSLNIKLDDRLGEELLQSAKEERDFITDPDEFGDYMFGMVLKGDEPVNEAIVGIRADSLGAAKIRLYYSELKSGVRESDYFDIQVTTRHTFSSVQSQRRHPLNKLVESRDAISSTTAENKGYLEGGVGLMTRIDFPYLERLKETASIVDVNAARLKIFPVKDTYGEQFPLPKKLVAHVADEYNHIIGTISDSKGRPIYAGLRIDREFKEHTHYSVDITSFFRDEFYTNRYTGRGIMISLPQEQYSSTVNRVVLGGPENEEFEMYLQLDLNLLNYE